MTSSCPLYINTWMHEQMSEFRRFLDTAAQPACSLTSLPCSCPSGHPATAWCSSSHLPGGASPHLHHCGMSGSRHEWHGVLVAVSQMARNTSGLQAPSVQKNKRVEGGTSAVYSPVKMIYLSCPMSISEQLIPDTPCSWRSLCSQWRFEKRRGTGKGHRSAGHQKPEARGWGNKSFISCLSVTLILHKNKWQEGQSPTWKASTHFCCWMSVTARSVCLMTYCRWSSSIIPVWYMKSA